MGKFYPTLNQKLQDFTRRQKIFFVSTAPEKGRINISPKGYEAFRILNEGEVVFLNMVGSGNETAGHLLENKRITIMFCSFETEPMILKIYGQGRAIHPGEEGFAELIQLFPSLPGTRQLIHIQIESVQTSCGDGVPFFDFVGERSRLIEWAEEKGPEKVKDYQDKNNRLTIDGKTTGLP